MGPWRGRVVVAWVAALVVAGLWWADRNTGADFSDAVPGVRAVLIAAAVVVAGICYQSWSTQGSRAPRLIAAVITSLLGGALTASAATSAPHGEILVSGPLPLIGIIALWFAAAALTAESVSRKLDSAA